MLPCKADHANVNTGSAAYAEAADCEEMIDYYCDECNASPSRRMRKRPSQSSRGCCCGSGRKRRGIRMIEFFSGIGGMRLGVERALNEICLLNGDDDEQDCDGADDGTMMPCSSCGRPIQRRQQQQQHEFRQELSHTPLLQSCRSYEISIYANETYMHNFDTAAATPSSSCINNAKGGDFTVRTKLIEQLRPDDVDGPHNSADLWTMSPPCQPFTNTTNAKRNDMHDKRCEGFRAVMRLLDAIHDKPTWILLENVKGFVGSEMLDAWYDCLERCGYSWREYLLSPVQFGVPNHRTRYYMICERSDRFFVRSGGSLSSDGSSRTRRGDIATRLPEGLPNGDGGVVDEERGAAAAAEMIEIRPLSHYIDASLEAREEELERYVIPEDVLRKQWARGLPVVNGHDRASRCFTAAYGRVLHRATGSLFLMDGAHAIPGDDHVPDDDGPDDDPGNTSSRSLAAAPVGRGVADRPIDRSDMVRYSGRLRRFAPHELLALFGFPTPEFEFPPGVSLEHRYKLVGNSVNVAVVARVAVELLSSSSSVMMESA